MILLSGMNLAEAFFIKRKKNRLQKHLHGLSVRDLRGCDSTVHVSVYLPVCLCVCGQEAIHLTVQAGFPVRAFAARSCHSQTAAFTTWEPQLEHNKA